MTQRWDAVVAGHICLDVIPDLSGLGAAPLSALLRPGQLVEVGDPALATGGPVSNTGLALHILGMKTQLMGKLGDDPLGSVVRQIVADHGAGLADGMVVDPEAATSYSIIISPPGIDRIFLHSPGANNTFGAADVRYDVVAQARLFHFGYPPLMRRMYADDGAELIEIYRRVRALEVTTSLDMAMPDPATDAGRADWVTILEGVLPFVDVFLPSVEEILFMLRRSQYDAFVHEVNGDSVLSLVTPALLSDLSDELLSLGGRVVGLKLGDRGFYLRTASETEIGAMGAAAPADPSDWADRELWVPCFKTHVVGTTGAGDATIAGFLAALLRGLPVKDAARMAVAVGACNVEAADALGGLRSWEETEARVAEGWPQRELTLIAPGWHHDQVHGLWEQTR